MEEVDQECDLSKLWFQHPVLSSSFCVFVYLFSYLFTYLLGRVVLLRPSPLSNKYVCTL
jgi:hypothetical protein